MVFLANRWMSAQTFGEFYESQNYAIGYRLDQATVERGGMRPVEPSGPPAGQTIAPFRVRERRDSGIFVKWPERFNATITSRSPPDRAYAVRRESPGSGMATGAFNSAKSDLTARSAPITRRASSAPLRSQRMGSRPKRSGRRSAPISCPL